MADEISREKEKVIGVFDRAASIYDRVGPRVFSHFGRRLVEMAALAPGMRVLDVAAGRGAQLFPAAKAVGASGRVIGIDLSADMVRETSAEIQNLGLGNAEIRRMDGEALDFPDAEFDRVLCGMALWMFSRPEVALREFLRVLKPGGRLGVCTWARDCPYQNIRDELMRPYLPPGTSSRAKQTGVMFKMPEELLEALALAGFEDARVSVEEHELVFESEDDWMASHWMTGFRNTLERLSPPELDQALTHLRKGIQVAKQEDGIHLLARALMAFAVKR